MDVDICEFVWLEIVNDVILTFVLFYCSGSVIVVSVNRVEKNSSKNRNVHCNERKYSIYAHKYERT